jgi:prefoldin subunit 5
MMGDRLLEMFLIEEIARLNREINHLRQEIAAFERMLRKIREPPRRK